MFRTIRLLALAGVVGLTAALAGCAARGDASIEGFLRNEGFTITGHSERRLGFILRTIREMEDIDRPL